MAGRHRAASWALPLLVAAGCLALTAALVRHELQDRDERLRSQFDLGLRQAAARLTERMASFEQALLGARGLYLASSEVTEPQFARYVDSVLSGADTVGLRALAQVARRADGGAVVAQVAPQAAPALLARGTPLQQVPAVRAALEAASESGHAVLSGPLPAPDESHFLLCAALFPAGVALNTPAERRAATWGWACAGFRAVDLVASQYGETIPGLQIRLHNGPEVRPDNQLAGPPPATAGRTSRLAAREYLDVAGNTWTLSAETTPAFEESEGQDSARDVLLLGLLVSAALSLLTWQLVTSRDRASALARTMTQQLRDSAERYRRIVENVDEGIWTVDAEGRTTFSNPKMQRLLGATAEQLQGRPWAEYLEPGDAQALLRPALEALGPGQALRRELRLLPRQGTAPWVTLAASPVYGKGGHFAGCLALVTDVSERHEAESRRLALEEQLRASQKMEAIGTLAGGIAHDFNNLLGAILAQAAQAQQDLGDPTAVAGRLQQIERAGSRGRSLVQQILTFSRREPLQRETQALGPLVEDAARLLRATLPTLVELDLRLSPEHLPVSVNATQLQQVLLNLCTNAWHAMGGGTGRIVIGLEAAPGAARLWVADNGTGMDAATRERVFDPFFTTKPVGQGTGLGLAVVHGIVAAHGGSISVSSQPGQGSRFDLLLPLAAAPAPAPPALAPPALAPPTPLPLPRGQGEHVLYVDDDEFMRTVVDSLLQSAGYRTTCMANPEQAVARATQQGDPVDLLVTDFNMPGLSGLDLVHAVRKLRPALPVIVSTGFVSDELPAQAQAAGVSMLLEKQYTAERLVGVVQQVLRQRVLPGDAERAERAERAEQAQQASPQGAATGPELPAGSRQSR